MSKSKRSIDGRLGDVYDTFQTVKAAMGLTGDRSDKACLAQLIAAYQTPHAIEVDTLIQLLGCRTEEIAEINVALSVEYADIWEMLKEGLLTVVRQRNQYVAPESQLHDAQTRKARKTGGKEHVAAIVAQLMHVNEQAEHTFQQLYLSVGAVKKMARVHGQTVDAYFAEHAEAIAAHNHTILGIGSDVHGARHNLLRAKYLQAERAGTGVQFLARYGARLVRTNGSDISAG